MLREINLQGNMGLDEENSGLEYVFLERCISKDDLVRGRGLNKVGVVS